MAKIDIKTTKETVPTIYSYSTPEIARHNGWTKIGYTEQDVDKRLGQQTHTADVEYKLEWSGNAVFEGSNDTFSDKDFHAYLRKNNIEEMEGKDNEWFHVDGPTGRNHFYDFRQNRGILSAIDTVIPYNLRDEQEQAVKSALEYATSHENGEYLFNCKPRFGKSLSTYDLIKRLGAQTVLIVTNRPAIANSWYDDYVRFMGDESGLKFVSRVDAIKDKPYCLSRQEYLDGPIMKGYGCIEFVSLQDLKGSKYFNPHSPVDKLSEVRDITWDILVIDEAHEGVDTYKTDVAFNRINRKFTLHLSGTPFKALANDKFNSDAIFNWTYADEQAKKENWDGNGENPYGTLPQLCMLTYQMSEIIKEEIDRGVEINGETEEYAFDLNEFFSTTGTGAFRYDSAVNRFLDALATQTKFPFSTPELRAEIKHSFWLLNRVDSAKALARKLETHPVFSEYKVVLAAGDGKLDDETENQKSFDAVRKAIAENDKTITLSVGQLTTGVTIPEWTAVLMLSNMKSPSLYMQAAFRAQNPCLFHENGKHYRKERAYVFDFDPARTLTVYEEFANDLCADTAAGRGNIEQREKNIKRLLNFFPVLAEDDEGEMIELDAAKVLSIPRKIKSVEVVRRGFMSNFLFQNISNIFSAPKEVIEIIENCQPLKEPKSTIPMDEGTKDGLSINDEGEVELTDDYVIGVADDVFGDKIYDTEEIEHVIDQVMEQPGNEDEFLKKLKESFKEKAVDVIVGKAKDNYGDDMRTSDKKFLERSLKAKSDRMVDRIATDYEFEKQEIETERQNALKNLENWGKESAAVNEEFDKKQKEAAEKLKETLSASITEFAEEASKDVVKHVETKKKEREKESIEDSVRDHLRGFSRTIPSFLMAYGDDTVTLATFDEKVPNKVFVEVTSITLDQFRFLRDGGNYTDEETGEEKHFAGNLFDPVVFDDSVKEFLRLKKKLADYFDEKAIEDIFDYIPPQKTNQIYTPKDVVKRMVDMLEEENPGCFDAPDKTFIDLYMKSGLYITEIVKRLYQSDEMKRLFPDGQERLKHIFANQVYGLAPTEIIYKIATNYILGFDEDVSIEKHNFRQADAVPYVKEGKLDELLNDLYDGKE